MDRISSSGSEQEASKPSEDLGKEESSHVHQFEHAASSSFVDNDPVHILQLSQNFYVADTLDDESLIIPPTQDDTVPFLIPSTPTLTPSKKEDEILHDESFRTALRDFQPSKLAESEKLKDTSALSDITEDPSDVTRSDLEISGNLNSTCEKNGEKNVDDDNDEWHLQLTGSEGTQVFGLDPDKKQTDEIPESQEPKSAQIDSFEKTVPADDQELQYMVESPVLPNTEVDTSDDEIEPSQTILTQYQGETIFSCSKFQSQYNIESSKVNGSSEESPPEITSMAQVLSDSKEDINLKGDKTCKDSSDEDITLKNDSNNVKEDSESDRTLKEDSKTDRTLKEDSKTDRTLKEDSKTDRTLKDDSKTDRTLKDDSKTDKSLKDVFKCDETVEDVSETGKNQKAVSETDMSQKAVSQTDMSQKTVSETDMSQKDVSQTDKSIEDVSVIEQYQSDSVTDKCLKDTCTTDSVVTLEEEILSTQDIFYLATQPILSSAPSAESSEDQPLNENAPKLIAESETVKEIFKTPKGKVDQLSRPRQTPSSHSSPFNVLQSSRKVPASRRPKKEETKLRIKSSLDLSSTDAVMKGDLGETKLIGSFSDVSSLDDQLHNGESLVTMEQEQLMSVLSMKPTEEKRLVKVVEFIVKDKKVFLTGGSYKIDTDKHIYSEEASPHSSISTSSSSVKTSIHSGELGDISSSLSSKSSNVSSVQQDTTINSECISSQESSSFVKTSTQNSQAQSNFSTAMSKIQEEAKDGSQSKRCSSANTTAVMSPLILLSPIESGGKKKKAQTSGAKSKKAKRTSSSDETVPPKKRQKTKTVKNKKVNVPKPEGLSSDVDLKDFTSTVAEPKKRGKRKKEEASTSKEVSKQTEEDRLKIESHDFKFDDAATEESYFGSIIPGMRVMAPWRDTFYYPGLVISQELEGRWKVQFDDGCFRIIPQENLLKLALLKVGTSVLVPSNDDQYDPGFVYGHYREGSVTGYIVELDNNVLKKFPKSSVILSTDQAKILISSRPPTTPPTMTINLDNIIDGKRKRKSLQDLSPASSSAVKKSPRTLRRRAAAVVNNLDSTESSTSEYAYSEKSLPAKQTLEISTEKVKKPPSRQKKPRTSKKATVKFESTAEINAPSGSGVKKMSGNRKGGTKQKLFTSYAFLLSNAENKFKPEGSESSETEEIVLFDKDELCLQILSEDGMILDKFEDSTVCEREHICLLANTFLRTIKYMQCLAAGISCVKHHWIKLCIIKREVLDINDFMLPGGFSIITSSVHQWHGKSDVFKDMKIALVSDKKSQFVHIWAPVLQAAKADFVQKWVPQYSVSGSFLDVLVTNSYCPNNVLAQARKRKIPIVSSEWIIQSLVAGEKLPFDVHPKFVHNYTE